MWKPEFKRAWDVLQSCVQKEIAWLIVVNSFASFKVIAYIF